MLEDLDGDPLEPSYVNGGTWLPLFKRSNVDTARMVRLITNHAPISQYYNRFHIDSETLGCRQCGSGNGSRGHLMDWCPNRKHHPPHFVRRIHDVVNLLVENPTFFAMPALTKREGVG